MPFVYAEKQQKFRIDIESSAVISPCGLYRYSLTRRWGAGAPLVFVMLNPSTADALKNDRTIVRCLGFTHAQGCRALQVVNLFAWRATDPEELPRLARDVDHATIREAVGPDNDRHIVQTLAGADRIVAAWGGSVPKALAWRVAEVRKLLEQQRRPIWSLGRTKQGEPRHPVRLPKKTPLSIFFAPT